MGKKIDVLESPPPEVLSALERANKREDTRSKIALYYVIGFLLLVAVTIFMSWHRGLETNDLRDMLISISGILSGPLGFIIGYYFKSHASEE